MTLREHLARAYLQLDPRALGLVRIALAGVLALDLARRTAAGERTLLAAAGLGVVYMLFAIGWHTRLVAIAAAVHAIATQRTFDGATMVLLGLLVPSVLVPLGERFSLDALRRAFAERQERTAQDLELSRRPRHARRLEVVPPQATARRVRAFLLALLGLLMAWLAGARQQGALAVSLAPLVPLLIAPSQLDALGRAWAHGRPRLRCFFDEDCGICFFCARLLARLDVFGLIELRGNHETAALPPGIGPEVVRDTIVVVELERGRVYLRSEAIARLLLTFPLGSIPFAVLRMPGLRGLFERLYDLVARNRIRISASLGLNACGVPSPSREPSEAPP